MLKKKFKVKKPRVNKLKNKKILINKILLSMVCLFLLILIINALISNYIIELDEDEFKVKRLEMVEQQLKSRDIVDEKLLDAMKKVPRHEFMPHSRNLAYEDHPVPIGYGQTISQPYIVALMIQELELKGDEIVLEIGAGSGYNAAVLGELVKEVYTIEIIEQLADWSKKALKKTGYDNVYVKHADGYYGWEGKTFDAVIITAAANHVPQPLIDQLKMNGKLIMPLASQAGFQALTLITKTPQGLETKMITGVRFVPMTGRAQR